MHDEFTAIIEQDEGWFIAYCLEIPGANGQGRTVDDCRANLAEAIALILEDPNEDDVNVFSGAEKLKTHAHTIRRNNEDYSTF